MMMMLRVVMVVVMMMPSAVSPAVMARFRGFGCVLASSGCRRPFMFVSLMPHTSLLRFTSPVFTHTIS